MARNGKGEPSTKKIMGARLGTQHSDIQRCTYNAHIISRTAVESSRAEERRLSRTHVSTEVVLPPPTLNTYQVCALGHPGVVPRVNTVGVPCKDTTGIPCKATAGTVCKAVAGGRYPRFHLRRWVKATLPSGCHRFTKTHTLV